MGWATCIGDDGLAGVEHDIDTDNGRGQRNRNHHIEWRGIWRHERDCGGDGDEHNRLQQSNEGWEQPIDGYNMGLR